MYIITVLPNSSVIINYSFYLLVLVVSFVNEVILTISNIHCS